MKKTALLLGAVLFGVAAQAAPHGVKIGILTCNVDGGWGYVLGSSKDVRCRYHPNHGEDDRYVGSISKIGVDIGYTSSATIVWDVVAPSSDTRAGALQGDYGGATASATLAVGLGAHVLFGGFDKSIALQPVSVESSSGLDIAAGIGALSLRIAPPEPVASNSEVVIHPANYALWFEFNDDHLTPSGRVVVADAVRDAQRSGAQRILVTGHADNAGTDGYNQDLSLRRAETVKQEMIRDGIDADRVVVDARGDRDPVVPTPAGVRDPENRRVVISWQTDPRMKQASR